MIRMDPLAWRGMHEEASPRRRNGVLVSVPPQRCFTCAGGTSGARPLFLAAQSGKVSYRGSQRRGRPNNQALLMGRCTSSCTRLRPIAAWYGFTPASPTQKHRLHGPFRVPDEVIGRGVAWPPWTDPGPPSRTGHPGYDKSHHFWVCSARWNCCQRMSCSMRCRIHHQYFSSASLHHSGSQDRAAVASTCFSYFISDSPP